MSIRSKVLKEIEKKPRRLRDLKAKLGNDKKVQRAVDELLKKGRICQKNGAYFPAWNKKSEGAILCTLVKIGPNFGFAQPVEKDSRDVFIPGRKLSGALPGDQVMVSLSKHPRLQGSLEGEILAVTLPREHFVGTVVEENGRLFLVPDDCTAVHLQIKKSAAGGVAAGDKAAVEILERGIDYQDHRVGVATRFGSSKEARQCVRALVYAAKMSRHFPEKVKAEGRRLTEPDAAEIKNRRDLRSWPIFTIDSAQTKDIDDAISLKETENGYQLGVHIADVSYYVKAGGELDKEAYNRGSSVYYADSVLPMLPKQLSNNLCSLNEGADRLAFSCIMQLNRAGEVTGYEFVKSVIRSRVKGVYSEINSILAGTAREEVQAKYSEVLAQLPLMHRLYQKLNALRKARGYVELESVEPAFVLDAEGRCVDVKPRERGETEGIIEEFMLLANECAARLARTKQLPLVYRIHEAPEEERAERLRLLLEACGVQPDFAGEIPTQQELAALLACVKDLPCRQVVNQGVLHTMSKARYAPEPKGHFGLALEDYAHFTSPIRRYSDLAVHRILTEWCEGASAAEITQRYEEFARDASLQASNRELAVLQLERSAEDCYKAEFMHGHLGEEFDGVVSGVAKQGVYVQLPNTIEGLVRTETICKGEPELTEGLSLWDPVSGNRWKLGQPVRIQVAAANVATRHIDFEML